MALFGMTFSMFYEYDEETREEIRTGMPTMKEGYTWLRDCPRDLRAECSGLSIFGDISGHAEGAAQEVRISVPATVLFILYSSCLTCFLFEKDGQSSRTRPYHCMQVAIRRFTKTKHFAHVSVYMLVHTKRMRTTHRWTTYAHTTCVRAFILSSRDGIEKEIERGRQGAPRCSHGCVLLWVGTTPSGTFGRRRSTST